MRRFHRLFRTKCAEYATCSGVEKSFKEGRKIKSEEKVKKALIKCATGHSTSEVVEEFSIEDGALKLVKKKATKREIPPDIKAVKLLLEEHGELTDEELEEERQKLIKILNMEEKADGIKDD